MVTNHDLSLYFSRFKYYRKMGDRLAKHLLRRLALRFWHNVGNFTLLRRYALKNELQTLLKLERDQEACSRCLETESEYAADADICLLCADAFVNVGDHHKAAARLKAIRDVIASHPRLQKRAFQYFSASQDAENAMRALYCILQRAPGPDDAVIPNGMHFLVRLSADEMQSSTVRDIILHTTSTASSWANFFTFVLQLQDVYFENRGKHRDIQKTIFQVLEHERAENMKRRMLRLIVEYPDDPLSSSEINQLVREHGLQDLFLFFSTVAPNVKSDTVLAANDYVDKISRTVSKNDKVLSSFAALVSPHDFHLSQSLLAQTTAPRIAASSNLGGAHTSASPLKVAVCVSGQLRGFRRAQSTWSAFHQVGCEVDYFVSVWRSIGRKLPLPGHAKRTFSGAFLTAYRDVAGRNGLDFIDRYYPRFSSYFKSEGGEIAEDELSSTYKTAYIDIEDDKAPKFSGFSNYQKMYYKIERCWNMLEKAELSYDLIIRIRPDVPIVDFDLDYHSVLEKSCRDNTVFSDFGYSIHPTVGLTVGDQFAVGCLSAMNIYSKTYTHTLTARTRKGTPLSRHYGEFRPHCNLAFSLLERGVNVETVEGTGIGLPLDPEVPEPAHLLAMIVSDIHARDSIEADAALVSALEKDAARAL